MGLTTKETPPKPEEAPTVINARRELATAIKNQEKARAERDGLHRTLANPNADPAEKIRARLGLPDAEAAAEIAEINASARQADETVRLYQAVEAWRPVWEERYREALHGLYDALERHAGPANGKVRQVWLEAYSLGVELPAGFWTELFPSDPSGGGVESLFTFRRKTLQAEGWL